MNGTTLWQSFQNALRNRIGDENMEIVNRLIEESDLDANCIRLRNDYQNTLAHENLLSDFNEVCDALGIQWRRCDEPEC